MYWKQSPHTEAIFLLSVCNGFLIRLHYGRAPEQKLSFNEEEGRRSSRPLNSVSETVHGGNVKQFSPREPVTHHSLL